MPKSAAKKRKRNGDYCPREEPLNWEWYNPNEGSIPVSFCRDTSLHGLKYLGQQNRHVFERFFWLAAFVASVITSIILIWGMWSDYTTMPIITVFNPTETRLDQIPFPGVTICNVNSLQKETFDEQMKIIMQNGMEEGERRLNNPEHKTSNKTFKGLATLLDMNHVCDSVSTFTDRFIGNSSVLKSYGFLRDSINANIHEVEDFVDPISTLQKVSQPCKKMILHCVWLETVVPCGYIFKPIETDYGHCCTFNTIPIPLLLKNFAGVKKQTNKTKLWKEANLDYENLMFTKETEDRRFPYRQMYPGRSAGLSFLLDPDLDEYFCTNTDSEGFIMGINVPLDFPRMKDIGISLQTNSEIFVGLRPEVTMSHDSIKSFPVEKRQCYYGNEYELPHYTKYTVSNCMNECIARKTFKKCNCLRYYMPRDVNVQLCKPNMYSCTNGVRKELVRHGLRRSCSECLPTCTEIEYSKEVTFQTLQKKKIDELFHAFPINNRTTNYNDRKVSIVHVSFNTDSVHPKLRKELTTMTELISNAGGLLGLCMGFSVLSLLEILYYGSLRLCCNSYREKTIRDNVIIVEGNEHQREKQRRGHSDGAIHPKQGWFSQVFNGASSHISDIDKTASSNQTIKLTIVREETDEDNEYLRHGVFKSSRTRIANQPVNYSGFPDEFQKTFLVSAFPETAFPTYAK